ncbi:MAG: hypothetical protein J6S85_10075 [Methanobrevibacter sp.]|nr:hypothetical protein [Methanobrevibacter sp.]
MKKLVLLFCLFLVFVACSGKDKTIEKIIYGDKSSVILDKEAFNKIPTTKSCNNFDELATYINQCAEDKTNLAGKKIKVKGVFNISGPHFVSIDEKHYSLFQCNNMVLSESPHIEFWVKFIDSDKNKTNPGQVEMELTCIVSKCQYQYPSYFVVEVYSYDI